MERFVITTVGADDEALALGVVWLTQYATQNGKEAAIVVPGIQSIDNLGRIIGASAAQAARKSRQVTINEVPVHLLSPKTQSHSFDGPVLVPWASTKMVEDAERLYPPAICAVSWNEHDLDEWIRAHSPVNLKGEQPSASDPIPIEVDGAVAKLSGISNDIVHPFDKERAINAFKALRMVGQPADPDSVKVIALQRNWTPDAANRLRSIAEKIAEGKAVRGGGTMNKTQAKKLVASFPDFAKGPKSD